MIAACSAGTFFRGIRSMLRRFFFAACSCMAAVWLLTAPEQQYAYSADESAAAPPHWIWCRDAGPVSRVLRAPAPCRFERRFTLDALSQSAIVRLAADFSTAAVEINGRAVATVEPYTPTLNLDVTAAFQRGENLIAIAA